MYKKNFTVDARTIIHLGRESIKDHTTALIELVKNSYDADASVVEVEIYQKETLNKIRIADNGIGMTECDIDNSWLRIGFSEKKLNKLSAKGRRKTGEKGIGRLSADRLGETLYIGSISNNCDSGKVERNGIKVNWELFNQDGIDLDEIPIEVDEDPQIILPASSNTITGTELIIKNIRNDWTVENIKSLCEELSILNSPFSETQDFKIFLKNDIAPQFNGEIFPPESVLPEIELELEYDGVSFNVKYAIKDRFSDFIPQKYDTTWQELSHKVIDPFEYVYSNEKLSCGPIKIKLLFYPRTKSLADGTNFTLSELKEFVDKNAGVKIYRDNISVKPYGYSNSIVGSDWLGLAERHTRNPAGVKRASYRLIPNQLVGAVFVSRDDNSLITDSAAREGLVENEAFCDLRALTLAAVSLLENHRYKLYQQPNENANKQKSSFSETATTFKREVEIAKENIDSIKEHITKSEDKLDTEQLANKNTPEIVRTALESLAKFVEETEDVSDSFNDMLQHTRVLAGLATVGISSAIYGHETQGDITQFKATAIVAKEYLEFDEPNIEVAKEELENSIIYADRVLAWGRFALSRVSRDKREKYEVSIKELITGLLKDLSELFKPIGIVVKYEKFEDVKATVYPMDIESILLNLLTNARTACLQISKNRIINIGLSKLKKKDRDGFLLSVSNSGPKINPELKEWIWEPLNTTKKDSTGRQTGTGLGLSIIKSIVADLKGDAEVDDDLDLGGALFKIWIPIK